MKVVQFFDKALKEGGRFRVCFCESSNGLLNLLVASLNCNRAGDTAAGVREAPDGRATWQYGPEVRPGEPHAVWRRHIDTHAILHNP